MFKKSCSRSICKSLSSKIILFSITLVSISVALTLITSYLVSYKIIRDKADYIDHNLTNVAAEKTNTVLGELANIINLSINNTNLNYIVENDDLMSYDFINARAEYEKYLRKLIMNYDKIDGIVFVNDKIMVYAKNSVLNEESRNRMTNYFYKIRELVKKDPESEFFLEKYFEDKTQNIAVIQPVLSGEGKEVQACVIVILSKTFSRELQFAGDSIYLMDQRGEYVSVNTEPEETPLNEEDNRKAGGVIQKDLLFSGWKIINHSTINRTMKDINQIFLLYLKFGILYIVISAIVAHIVSKGLTKPILSLNNEIKKLDNISKIHAEFFSKVSSRFRFRTKLLLFCSLIVTIPVIGISSGFYLKSRGIIQDKVGLISEYNADLFSQQINIILEKYLYTTVEILAEDKVQEYLDHCNENDKKQYDDSAVNEFVIQQQTQNQGIINVSLYNKDKDLLFSSFLSRYFVEMVGYEDDLDRIDSMLVNPLWKGVTESYLNKGYFTIGMQVRGISGNVSMGEKLGYILLYFDRNEISGIIDKFTTNGSMLVYCVDQNDKEVIEINNAGKDAEVVEQSLEAARNADKKDKRYMVIERRLELNGWKLIFIIPMKEYMKENTTFLLYSIELVLGLIVLCFFFSYGFSFFLGRNIERLLDVVREVKKGDLSIRFKSRTRDEIGELGSTFNEMLERMNHIIDEKIKYEIKAKDAEITAKKYELNLLQAQINPHFLFNTLKTVQYMIYSKDPQAEKMVRLLIYLFRTSITREEKIIKLSEELQHAKTYIQIQQIRFKGKFRVSYDIPADILDLYVLKLTLQPIVENAICHGLENCNGDGELLISARRCCDGLKITVRDNGTGITTEKLHELKDQMEGKAESRGIGIINVHERIQLHFGKEYGISIDSEQGCGTSVTLLFPVMDQWNDKFS